jgi:hypothetical protein
MRYLRWGKGQGSGRNALFGQDVFCLLAYSYFWRLTTVAISGSTPCPPPVGPLHAECSGLSLIQAIAVGCQRFPRNSFPVLLSLLSIGLSDFSGSPAKHLHCPRKSQGALCGMKPTVRKYRSCAMAGDALTIRLRWKISFKGHLL